jgi:hypothetical protein
MDMTETIAPKSDQLNADDLMAGPVTVTISEVTKGSPEQPVDVHLVEFPGRAYRPSKSMRRIMVSGWGVEAAAYAGRRLTLVRNPDITFGKDRVGGIEIAAMSDIDKPLTVALTATRGRRKNFTVTPLAAPRDWAADLILAGDDLDAVAALGNAAIKAHAPTEHVAAIRQAHERIKALTGGKRDADKIAAT